ncbi:MAG: hypothetical protein AAB541_02525 [Patescibacteria group bacterium]
MNLPRRKNSPKTRRLNTVGGRISPTRSPFQKRPPPKKSSKQLFGRFMDVLMLIVIGAGLIFFLTLKPRPQTIVSSNAYHPSTVYEAAANKAFETLRNRSKLTLDERGIIAALKVQFPEIDTVKIKLPIFSQIPTLWLGIAAPTFNFSSNDKLYVVGSNGVITGLSSQLTGASKLPSVIDQSGFAAEPGKQVLGTEVIAFINTLLAQCQRAGVKVASLTLPAAAQELDLRVQNQPYFVKFYLGGDVLSQAGQYLAAKHKFDTEDLQPEQYLDVRVAGKIYYK